MDQAAVNHLMLILSHAACDAMQSRHKLIILEKAMKHSQPALYDEYLRRLEMDAREDMSDTTLGLALEHLRELLQK